MDVGNRRPSGAACLVGAEALPERVVRGKQVSRNAATRCVERRHDGIAIAGLGGDCICVKL